MARLGLSSWSKGRKVEEKIVRKLDEFNEVEVKRFDKRPFDVRSGGNIEMVVKRKIGNQRFKISLKSRATDYGFKLVRDWLASNFNHFLIIAQDNKVPLVTMDYHMFKYIMDNFEPKKKWPLKNDDGSFVTDKESFNADETASLPNIGEPDET